MPDTSTRNLTDSGGCWGWANTDLDPDSQLGSLADNGGPTQTIALTATVAAAGVEAISAVNPAINTGDAATCDNAPVNSLDQRGYTRPTGGNCDIGAFEIDATLLSVTLGYFLATCDGDQVDFIWQTPPNVLFGC